ncbi:hypothetical protein OIE68_40220 [Nocardia vinacea]|uniref:NHL domain-containing protein n=1 Tax=Nocardia vinacea TaxID=96468 RepID=UPI002E14A591|nr:hypothetical protein OIE68_40220 [Nocardia vinacea]
MSTAAIATGAVTTVAGTGAFGYDGDNKLAIFADLGNPSGVAMDGAGNLYIADDVNHRVRRVDHVTGRITTVAGTGTEGYNGDDQLAVNADLNYPSGVAVDGAGNLYIADFANDRVRRVDLATGRITTVAGTSPDGLADDGLAIHALLREPQGVAVDGAGNFYIADCDNGRVRRVDPDGVITTVAGTGIWGYNGDNKPAIDAELRQPTDVAVDGAGNLYIADTNNNRVRRVDPAGVITTVAGTGTAGYDSDNKPAINAELNEPTGVAVDGAGNLYIADNTNQRVRRVDPDGVITTVAGTGTQGYNGDNQPAIDAELREPEGVAVDGAGNLYIADSSNNRVRRVEPVFTVVQDPPDPVVMTAGVSTQLKFTLSANTTVPAGRSIVLGFPSGVGLAPGGVVRYHCTDTDTPLPVTVGADGSVSVTAEEITASTGCFYSVDVWAPVFIEDVPEGTISIGGTTQPIRFRVQEPVFTVVQDAPDPVVMTAGVTTQLAFSVSANCTVPTGQKITLGFPAGVGLAPGGVVRYRCPDTGIDTPLPVTTSPNGSVSVTANEITTSTTCFYSADVQAPAIPGGTVCVGGTTQPIHFSVEAVPLQTLATHRRYTELEKREASKSTAAIAIGAITTVAGTDASGYNGDNQPAINAELNSPSGVAVDGAGNLYIADTNNNRVRRVDHATGRITTVAGTGTNGYNGDNQPAINAGLGPFDVAVDGAGNLYIADLVNQRVRRVDPAGVITTVAGTGTAGYNGDNQPAINAKLNEPNGVAVDGAGNLYIADLINQRVRRVDHATGVITTVAGTGTQGYNGDNQPAIHAELYLPRNVAVDGAGNLYIGDEVNDRVRRVDPAGVITTVAGCGTQGYNGDNQPAISTILDGPCGVAVEGAGNLYIADRGDQRARRVDHATGRITTVAGTGTAGYNGDNQPAINAELSWPQSVAVDGMGNLYIVDTGNARVRKVEHAVFTVVQDPPDPVVMTPGVTTQLKFTVSANATIPAGQTTITLDFPAGVGLAPGGVVRYVCPDTGTDTELPVTVGPDGSVSVTAEEITASTACFYTADVQASTIPEGTVCVGGTTQPTNFRINL